MKCIAPVILIIGFIIQGCSSHKVHCPEQRSDFAAVASAEGGLSTGAKNKYDKNGRLKKKGGSIKTRMR